MQSSLEGLQGTWTAGSTWRGGGEWKDLPPNFLQNSSFSGIQGPPLSQVS